MNIVSKQFDKVVCTEVLVDYCMGMGHSQQQVDVLFTHITADDVRHERGWYYNVSFHSVARIYQLVDKGDGVPLDQTYYHVISKGDVTLSFEFKRKE